MWRPPSARPRSPSRPRLGPAVRPSFHRLARPFLEQGCKRGVILLARLKTAPPSARHLAGNNLRDLVDASPELQVRAPDDREAPLVRFEEHGVDSPLPLL